MPPEAKLSVFTRYPVGTRWMVESSTRSCELGSGCGGADGPMQFAYASPLLEKVVANHKGVTGEEARAAVEFSPRL